jgi:hypothetical protein
MAASAQVNSRMQHVISTPYNGTGYIDFGVNIFLDMGIGADDCCGLASRLLEQHGWQGTSWNKVLQGTYIQGTGYARNISGKDRCIFMTMVARNLLKVASA